MYKRQVLAGAQRVECCLFGNGERTGNVDAITPVSYTHLMVHNRKEVPADLAGVDAVVFGHSHKYAQEEKDGVLWLNPGSCGPRRFHQEITMMTAEVEMCIRDSL